jgi:hypothetical protein
MDGICSVHGRAETSIWNFSLKIWKKEIIWMT